MGIEEGVKERLIRMEMKVENIEGMLCKIDDHMAESVKLRALNQVTLAIISERQENELIYRNACDKERAEQTIDIQKLRDAQNRIKWTAAGIGTGSALIVSTIAGIAGLFIEYFKKG